MRYRLISSETTLKSFPYKIHLDWMAPDSLLFDIYLWLNKENIKYEYGAGNYCFFKDEQDVVAFKLKWG